ncbi:hypothetical protein I204_07454 [Kwoniella mangroviensis CBS 8886]|uniref:hypothetical protein n=1 Tax=Kwoniella mangroviensis CBS 8507 TaxID=1296122 RepID=UPI00080D4FD0|nr:uncharacterized protein I203_08171 [Kwoniella mangroviensis CBS 8507]OCF62759.1 hypothetical protein I203_08171 [Kwoniella mangroviensis CBS 8507]OCF72189.1 hypothetical protein I204_07454 [Kwoniella mangroviensis CBS 8886]
MGISGLLPLLKEIQVSGHVSEFKGKRLAVDAYVWLHKGAFGCAEDLVKGKKTTKFVDYAMHRVRMLRYHGITPFIVFDGGPLPAKKGTEVSRARSRAENLERARSMESQGRWREARDFYTRCLDITPEMAYQLIKALKAENVDYVVAPYEADAQLCYLEREGFVDGIITEDSDLLVFGCRQVIFKLDGNGQCVWIHRNNLATIRDFPMHGWTDVQFRRMAMLSGCDYLDSIVGIGLKKAHALMRRFKTVEKLLQHVRLEGSMTIPPDYLISFAQAELAFIHQRVYCPEQGRLVPLNDFPEGGLGENDERWIGLDVEEEIARGMAKGDLHPETRLPIVDEWPDYHPAPRVRPLTENFSKINATVSAGPMDAFVTRMKKTRSLPKSVGTLGSGPSRLSDQDLDRFSAPAVLSGTRHESTGSKKSKFFSRPSKREITPELEEPLHWEDDQESEEIESQPVAGPSRIPASTPHRSPSPAISSIREDDSPVKSVISGHILTSPGCVLSSPPDSPSRGILFSTPRRKDHQIRECTPPSPTGASVGENVLIAASSQVLETEYEECEDYDYDNEANEDMIEETQVDIPAPTPTQSQTRTPARKERKSLSRLSTIVIPNSSSPFTTTTTSFVPETQSWPMGRKLKPFASNSSDTISAEEQLITPSLDQINQRKRKRSIKQEVIGVEDEIEDEGEKKRLERARIVADGWKAKYAFEQKSSSPASIPSSDDVPNKPTKRTKSDPTIRPRPEPVKRPTLPITSQAQASRVLLSRDTNVPTPRKDQTPASRKYSLGPSKEDFSSATRKNSDNDNFGQKFSSSPLSFNDDELIFESTQKGGQTYNKLQKYKFGGK